MTPHSVLSTLSAAEVNSGGVLGLVVEGITSYR